MPVPKRKRSRSRRDKRFANKGMKEKSFTKCAHCQEPISTHQACVSCGYYKGRKIISTKADRAVKRVETRQAKQAAQQQAAPQEAPIEAKPEEK